MLDHLNTGELVAMGILGSMIVVSLIFWLKGFDHDPARARRREILRQAENYWGETWLPVHHVRLTRRGPEDAEVSTRSESP